MCSLGKALPMMEHIGPCPSFGNQCNAWAFRSFAKKAYAIERACLGERAGVAYTSKYSLALLSNEQPVRNLAADDAVVVRPAGLGGIGQVCIAGSQKPLRVHPSAMTWDVVNPSGVVTGWWP
jgi:hypothetical protein